MMRCSVFLKSLSGLTNNKLQSSISRVSRSRECHIIDWEGDVEVTRLGHLLIFSSLRQPRAPSPPNDDNLSQSLILTFSNLDNLLKTISAGR
jgi:hypothetical protein